MAMASSKVVTTNADLPRDSSSISASLNLSDLATMDDLLNSAKTVDDVWKEIVAGGASGTHNPKGITLEDYLTKAAAVGGDVDVPPPPPPPPPPTTATKGKRRAVEEAVDKATLQKQRRMIKNRESAARSRERKQAYTSELEYLVQQLEQENARLLSEEADKQHQRYKQLMECLIPIVERREPRQKLRRTNSVQSI